MYTVEELRAQGKTLSDFDSNEIVKEMMESLSSSIKGDRKLAAMTEYLNSGTATINDVYVFSNRLGSHLEAMMSKYFSADVIGENGISMEQIKTLIGIPSVECNKLVMKYCNQIFNETNARAGINVVSTELGNTGIFNLYFRNLLNVPEQMKNAEIGNDYSSGDSVLGKIDYLVKGPSHDLTVHVDTQLTKAISVNQKAGITQATIKRTNAGGDQCPFCRAWINKGELPYTNKGKALRQANFFWRHRYCKCGFEYTPAKKSIPVEIRNKTIEKVSTDLNNIMRSRNGLKK